jgi:hypothetical protein
MASYKNTNAYLDVRDDCTPNYFSYLRYPNGLVERWVEGCNLFYPVRPQNVASGCQSLSPPADILHITAHRLNLALRSTELIGST